MRRGPRASNQRSCSRHLGRAVSPDSVAPTAPPSRIRRPPHVAAPFAVVCESSRETPLRKSPVRGNFRARLGWRHELHAGTCREDERAAILAIVNAAGEAYRERSGRIAGTSPHGRRRARRTRSRSGVSFWGYESDGALVGVMGIQPVGDVDLIRHAYVLPDNQGNGTAGALLAAPAQPDARRMPVGTWAAAKCGLSASIAASAPARLGPAQEGAARDVLEHPGAPHRDLRGTRVHPPLD